MTEPTDDTAPETDGELPIDVEADDPDDLEPDEGDPA